MNPMVSCGSSKAFELGASVEQLTGNNLLYGVIHHSPNDARVSIAK